MNTSAMHDEPLAVDVTISDDVLSVRLSDGRSISTPLVWYPRLLDATETQRQRWELLGGGIGIYWPELDEDLSVRGMLLGHRADGTQQGAAA